MIILIGGASCCGKTLLAQKMLEKYKFPYLSIDHLKMGLIRSDNTALSPEDSDDKITAYLWPIVREIIKTAIENEQNLIIEGCYIPFTWKQDFEEKYLKNIRYTCIIFSEKYINEHFDEILAHCDDIEKRLYHDISFETLLNDNKRNLYECVKNNCEYILIEDKYEINI